MTSWKTIAWISTIYGWHGLQFMYIQYGPFLGWFISMCHIHCTLVVYNWKIVPHEIIHFLKSLLECFNGGWFLELGKNTHQLLTHIYIQLVVNSQNFQRIGQRSLVLF